MAEGFCRWECHICAVGGMVGSDFERHLETEAHIRAAIVLKERRVRELMREIQDLRVEIEVLTLHAKSGGTP